ncbi:MAG: NAD(P) transhydrogenase subunit beta [Planctomycetota bacterium]|jgi:NAD(P) transhydrogenase subunit beta
MDWTPAIADLGFVLAAVLFIVGLKKLGSPRTAPRGNAIGALGMLVAVVACLVKMGAVEGFHGTALIISGLAVGSIIGAVMAKRVAMTGMPEMVALLNGFGGAASALVASAELVRMGVSYSGEMGSAEALLGRNVFLFGAAASSIIGWLTLTGSLVAMLKLNGTIKGGPPFGGVNFIKALLLLAALALAALLFATPSSIPLLVGMIVVTCLLGLVFVWPIGGADMPVVISFLNSLSGLAASATGFVVNNDALIISGALVGAAGLILTAIMCKAMNRKFLDVMFKSFGAAAASGTGEKRSARGYDAEEAAMAFDGARLVIIVPGYGMAVSQSQHAVRELTEELERRGTEVRFGIHPVAGRMPGHMNVLLAEANVPYEQLYDLDAINASFSECDVALVVGANDTVNPAAKTDPGGPLGGMPILDVDKARTVMIVKRSLSPGYAGVDNDLFYEPSTMMLFGDGKAMVTNLLSAVKEL